MSKRKIVRNVSLTLVCLFLGVVISLQYKGIANKKTIESQEAQTLSDAQAKIINAQMDNDSLRQEISELKYQIELLESGSNDKQIEYLRQQLDQINILAGLTDVKGKGLVLTLTFDPTARPSNEETFLRAVINDIKVAGAQAISINGERVVAMTEVRAAGNFIVVNNKAQSSPFEIKIIGDQRDLQNALNMPGSTLQSASIFNCTTSMSVKDEVVITKVEDNMQKSNLLVSAG
ncbi:MAG: DUF881 domain-containing protein [Clostridiales bacterium]|jgi:uncharacterized protein YlxW (UPF0749 family)|nr:DUF881 domain-containing protein [Clostridiales bacterium]